MRLSGFGAAVVLCLVAVMGLSACVRPAPAQAQPASCKCKQR